MIPDNPGFSCLPLVCKEKTELSPWRKFISGLADSPWKTKRIYEATYLQLKQRDKEALELWNKFPFEKKEFALEISSILKIHLDWPNHFFIPEDPFRLIFMDKSGDLDIEESAIELEGLIGKKLNESLWDSLLKKKYDEVIDFFLETRGEASKK